VGEAVTQERYPVPPEDLRWRAAGMRDVEGFLSSGRIAVEFLDKEALASERKSLGDFSSILDFGCGCGRLLRTLRTVCDQWAAIHGTDIDPSAITWCKQNIADASYAVNAEYPPLPYQDQSIDLVLASSVFSHLDADHQFRWLGELQRIVKPGGYVLASFRHGHAIEEIADETERNAILADLDRNGIAYRTSDAWKGVFPAWYGEAYHTPEYVQRSWRSYFEVCHIVPAGTIPEDTAVLRARESTFMQRLFQRP
jgi:ubiquinone/menaquinone biosynthesis C-methylase UbiE